MNKHQLTQDQIQTVVQCLSDGVEIPDHLLKSLSPSYFEKLFLDYNIDYQKLEKYKIPTIEYAGKRSEALILSQAGAMGGGSPLQVERCFENNSQSSSGELGDEWKNLIVQGDNLQFLKTCYLNQDPLIKNKVKGKVKLVYIDPPFATKNDFGGKEGESSYTDKIDRAEFLEAFRERIIFIREILQDDGCVYIHLDQKMSHYVKIVMDEIFGKDNFLNQIVWCYRQFSQAAVKRPHYEFTNDQILCYYKKSKPIFNTTYIEQRIPLTQARENGFVKDPGGYYKTAPTGLGKGGYSQEAIDVMDKKGLIYWTKNGLPRKKYYCKNDNNFIYDSKILGNTWTDILDLSHADASEKSINYPTQKRESLLERIISASTTHNSDELIIDCFAGSGTTGAVAEKLGRRWIMCDFGKHAIYTMQKRLLEISESKKLGKDVKNGEKYGKHAKPFCVASVGAYDFQRIMNLRENKPAYIDFVLSLFGITDRAKIENGEYSDNLEQKFKISNIFAQKDNNPVEVYPIWEDDFLKHIKIDQDYLEGIITQMGGKMRGKYYIIAPETCDVVGDTKIGEAEFIILSYPYKILEEMSRNFQLAEQPSSEENINDLVSSVRFYFNEDIEIGIERVPDGLKVTRLVTPILNKDGDHYDGFEGLAMLLVDKDYDGKTFRMEEAIYAKHIDEQGICKMTGLSDKVAVIAIDKHGNESKLTII